MVDDGRPRPTRRRARTLACNSIARGNVTCRPWDNGIRQIRFPNGYGQFMRPQVGRPCHVWVWIPGRQCLGIVQRDGQQAGPSSTPPAEALLPPYSQASWFERNQGKSTTPNTDSKGRTRSFIILDPKPIDRHFSIPRRSNTPSTRRPTPHVPVPPAAGRSTVRIRLWAGRNSTAGQVMMFESRTRKGHQANTPLVPGGPKPYNGAVRGSPYFRQQPMTRTRSFGRTTFTQRARYVFGNLTLNTGQSTE